MCCAQDSIRVMDSKDNVSARRFDFPCGTLYALEKKGDRRGGTRAPRHTHHHATGTRRAHRSGRAEHQQDGLLNCDPCGIFRARPTAGLSQVTARTGLRRGYLVLGLRWTCMCPQCVGSDADRTSYAYSLPPKCSMIDSRQRNRTVCQPVCAYRASSCAANCERTTDRSEGASVAVC